MGEKISKANSANSEPNVVPLCDILLVLLIIFMVIMPVSQQGIDIKLPASDGDCDSRVIVLSLKKSGEIFINKRMVPKPMLENELNQIYENRSEKNSVIFVQGDKTLPFKDITELIDIVKGAGIQKVALIPKQYPEN